jgi:hypothetical protein
MGMCEHSDHPPENCPHMTHQQFHDFASTPERGLPLHVTKKQKENLKNGFRKR